MAEDTDIRYVKEIVQSFQKARKNLRLYPANNPIYARTVEDVMKKLDAYLELRGSLDLKIGRNEIFFKEEAAYQGSGKDENLALLFFRDGLRELGFQKGLDVGELRGFLEILAYDFESEDVEEDVVTLMWGKDFRNIKYTVEETQFSEEDENYEAEAVKQAKEKSLPGDELEKVYADAVKEEAGVEHASIAPITEKDLRELAEIIGRDALDKKRKLINIVFNMLAGADSREEFTDVTHIANEVLEYCLLNGDIECALHVLRLAGKFAGSLPPTDERRKNLGIIVWYAGTPSVIKTVGELLDTETVDVALFNEYTGFLDKNAIQPLINTLGGLKSMEARKMLIEALVAIGRKDISSIARGLRDERWYVVRNIIYVLRKIGGPQVVDYLMKAARHSDVRVRKEVIVSLGEIGGHGAIVTLVEHLEDPEPVVRTTAARSLAKTGSEAAINALLSKVSGKEFLELDITEKKEYFEVLAGFKNDRIADYMMRTLKRTSLFKRAKVNEQKACAAFALGIMGHKDALPVLEKLRRSKDKLLSDYAYGAMRRIEYGR